MRGACWFCFIILTVPSIVIADVAPLAPRIPGTGIVVRPFAASVAAIALSAAALIAGWCFARNRGKLARLAGIAICLLVVGAAVALCWWSVNFERNRPYRSWHPPPLPIPQPVEPQPAESQPVEPQAD